jgi:hypothetical protein
MFQYFPGNYMWSLVVITRRAGGGVREAHYPENLQNAERKAQASKAAAGASSSGQ